MTNLAGFDVVAQVHVGTIVDLVNARPFSSPLDGKPIHLLGGPFETLWQLNLGLLGEVGIRGVTSITLQPLPHQSVAHLTISIDGGTFGPGPLPGIHVVATGTVTVPVGFLPPPPTGNVAQKYSWDTPLRHVAPALLLRNASASLTLSPATAAFVDAAIGAGGANRVARALEKSVLALMKETGNQRIAFMTFDVVPGVDSDQILQFSAMPVAAWIDGMTLGVFGYHRADATGGNVAAKSDSDVWPDESIYTSSSIEPILLARRWAILLSARSFHNIVVCPTLRNNVVASLLKAQRYFWIAQQIRDARREDDERDLTANMSLAPYLQEEVEQRPGLYLNMLLAALAHRQRDVEAIFDRIVKQAAEAQLDREMKSPAWQAELDDATPAPCGHGGVEVTQVEVVDDIWLVPQLRYFDLIPGDGHLLLKLQVGGGNMVEVGGLGAGFSYLLSGEVKIAISVNEFGAPWFQVFDPVIQPPEIHGSGLAAPVVEFINALLTIVPMKAVYTIVGLTAANKLAGVLNTSVAINPIPDDAVSAQFPVRPVDVKIATDAISIIGAIARRTVANTFNPGVTLTTSLVEQTRSKKRSTQGTLHLDRTKWGCEEKDFAYTRSFWDTTIRVRVTPRDVPAPFTFGGWTIETGHTRYIMPGLRDWRQYWSGNPQPLAAGHMALSGNVRHLEPPMDGMLAQDTDIAADITGDAEHGWTIRFRGEDGVFYVRFAMTLRDGDGKTWTGSTFTTIVGEQLVIPGYPAYQAECQRKYAIWSKITFGHTLERAELKPGDLIRDPVLHEAVTIRTLAAANDPSTERRIVAAAERYGDTFLRALGEVRPHDIAVPARDRDKP